MIHQVQAAHIADFSEVIGDEHRIVVSVGADLSPIILSLRQTPDYRMVKGRVGQVSPRNGQTCRISFRRRSRTNCVLSHTHVRRFRVIV